jgi:hypothetical protein
VTDALQGLNSTWNDNVQPNSNIPPLTEKFPYGSQPIKGISVGGWFILEVSSVRQRLIDVHSLLSLLLYSQSTPCLSALSTNGLCLLTLAVKMRRTPSKCITTLSSTARLSKKCEMLASITSECLFLIGSFKM